MPEPLEDISQVEELPDVEGLTPVRSLADLRSGPSPAHVREKLTPAAALRRYWGYDAFRPLQAESVANSLARRDGLIVLPTGGGKSLCYQVPAACGAGLVLVVSPLIALMDDQVAAAQQAGLSAGALHTNVADKERRQVREALAAGTLDLLYLSPERLVVGDILPLIAEQLALVAVDEAHCVSHWGHDFRPEYRQLRGVLDQVPKVPRLGLTATATPQVQDDICTQLGLRAPLRLVGHVDRPNLIYRTLPRRGGVEQALEVIRRHGDEGGIVYAQTRKEVERVAASLAAAGVHCAAYHAGLPAAERSRVMREFLAEHLDVVVATIAFGMGIDRSNVRYVVHYNAPKSIEHYQQEAGRAGRDGLPAECVLLFSGADIATHRRLATMDGPLAPERSRALERQLRDIGRYAVAPVCRHRLLTEHFGQPYPAPSTAPAPVADSACGACDVCLGETLELPADEALVIAQKIISAAWRIDGRFGAGHVIDVLLGRRTDKVERAGHDRLGVYGLLTAAGEAALRSWIDQLVVQGYLALREDGMFSFLVHTDAGKALCKGQGAVRLGRDVAQPKGKRGAKAVKGAAAPADLAPADQDLFARLRTLRKLIADHHGVPPYIVFNDVTLRALANQRPADARAMLTVKGVGESKLARYGSAFLAVIAGTSPEVAQSVME